MSPEGAADENAREWDGWAPERRAGVGGGVGSAWEDIPVLADPAGLEAEDVHPGQSQKSRAVWMLIHGHGVRAEHADSTGRALQNL